jgi:hypothetical protein
MLQQAGNGPNSMLNKIDQITDMSRAQIMPEIEEETASLEVCKINFASPSLAPNFGFQTNTCPASDPIASKNYLLIRKEVACMSYQPAASRCRVISKQMDVNPKLLDGAPLGAGTVSK